jgi:hypothetical protein
MLFSKRHDRKGANGSKNRPHDAYPSGVASPVTTNHAAKGFVFVNLKTPGCGVASPAVRATVATSARNALANETRPCFRVSGIKFSCFGNQFFLDFGYNVSSITDSSINNERANTSLLLTEGTTYFIIRSLSQRDPPLLPRFGVSGIKIPGTRFSGMGVSGMRVLGMGVSGVRNWRV